MTENISSNPATQLGLGSYYEALIEAQVRSGHYPDGIEVIRDGLRLIEQKELAREIGLAEIRAKVQKSRQDGKYKPANEVFDRLEAKYQALTNKQT